MSVYSSHVWLQVLITVRLCSSSGHHFTQTSSSDPIFSHSQSHSKLKLRNNCEWCFTAYLIGSFPHELLCRHFPDGRNSDHPSHIIVVKLTTCLITQLLQGRIEYMKTYFGLFFFFLHLLSIHLHVPFIMSLGITSTSRIIYYWILHLNNSLE